MEEHTLDRWRKASRKFHFPIGQKLMGWRKQVTEKEISELQDYVCHAQFREDSIKAKFNGLLSTKIMPAIKESLDAIRLDRPHVAVERLSRLLASIQSRSHEEPELGETPQARQTLAEVESEGFV